MIKKKDFLGVGWEFPPRFTAHGIAMVESDEDIKESLKILLSTSKGERVFRPEYGSKIRNWVFSKMNLSERTLLIDSIKQAIIKGEPRIIVNKIDVIIQDELEGILNIHIDYTIRVTNTSDNLVFPYFINQGEF